MSAHTIIDDYYAEFSAQMLLECPCGWSGPAEKAVYGVDEVLFEVSCPRCSETLLIVEHPTFEQARLAALAGNDEAIKTCRRYGIDLEAEPEAPTTDPDIPPTRPTVDTLRAARTLIAHPAHWTQGRGERLFKGARDANGRQCMPDNPRAVCWCATAAIAKVEPSLDGQRQAKRMLIDGMLYASLDRHPLWGHDPVWLNDHRPHEDVLAMFVGAIEKQQQWDRGLAGR